MSQAFIIMNIGRSDLDDMCAAAIVPALESCGLAPKRVDKHNQGGLLKSEIIRFIKESDIIVADLTNERPNCYLEVGYAMGCDKFKNLILTAREDHNQDAPGHVAGEPKIHFDLSGYDILFWRPDALQVFREELAKRIRRRLSIISNTPTNAGHYWDEVWIAEQTKHAAAKLAGADFRAGMAVKHGLAAPKPQLDHQQLLAAARGAAIHTFGWPIGLVLDTAPFAPRPMKDSVVAEVAIYEEDRRPSYDYWAFHKNGDYYTLKNLFEDEQHPSQPTALFFNTRIVQVAEAVMHCARLYAAVSIDPVTRVQFAVQHHGLAGRSLSSSNRGRHIPPNLVCIEDSLETILTTELGLLEADLTSNVKTLVQPLLTLFDFFELPDVVYEQIVNDFVQGHVT